MADIGQYQQSTFASPIDGDDATGVSVRSNDNAVAGKHNAHDADGTIHLLSFANLAAFPAASTRSGASAVASDTGRIYQSNGTTWLEAPYADEVHTHPASAITPGTFGTGAPYVFPERVSTTKQSSNRRLPRVDNAGPSMNIAWDDGNWQAIRLTGNISTVTFANPVVGAQYILELQQDATGGRTVTWPVGVIWPNGAPPTLTATGNRKDLIMLCCVSAVGAGVYLAVFVANSFSDTTA